MAVLRSLMVKLGFDADTSGAAQYEQAMTGVESQLQGLAQSARGFAVSFGGAIAAAFGVSAVKGFIDSQADLAVMLDQRRASIAATRTELQELGFVAQQGGIDVDEMQEAIADLADKTADAIVNGAGYADTLKQLGIEATDSAGKLKSPTALLFDFADAMQRTEDGAFKTFVANDLMGDSGSRLIPILNQGSEGLRRMMSAAHDAGAVISDEALDASLRYRSAQQALAHATTQLKVQLVSGLVPAITRIISGLSSWLRESGNAERAVRLLRIASLALGAALAGLALSKTVGALRGLVVALRSAGAAMTAARLGAIGLQGALVALPAALGLVALGLQDVATFVQGGESLTGDFIARFRDAEGVMGMIARTLESVAPRLAELWTGAVRLAQGALPALQSILQRLLPVVSGLAASMIRMSAGLVSSALPLLQEAVEALAPTLESVSDTAREVFDQISDAIAGMMPALRELVASGSETMRTLITSVAPAVMAAIGAIITSIRAIMPAVLAVVRIMMSMTSVVVPIIVKAISVVAQWLSWLVSVAASVVGSIWSLLSPLIDWLASVWAPVSDAVETFLGGIVEGFARAFEIIWSIVSPILDAVSGALGAAQRVAGMLGGATASAGPSMPAAFSPRALSQSFTAAQGRQAAQAPAGSSLSVGQVAVTVQAAPDMPPGQLERVVSGGVRAGITEADRRSAAREVS